MQNPESEIRDVVRSITEPYEAQVIADNVAKYFTENAYIIHPMLNQPRMKENSREYLIGIYKMLRVLTIGNKIEFHSVMFERDYSKAFIDLTEHLKLRHAPFLGWFHPRFLIRLELERGSDGLYRVSMQNDNLPSDPGQTQLYVPVLSEAINAYKYTVGFASGMLGQLLLRNRILGP